MLKEIGIYYMIIGIRGLYREREDKMETNVNQLAP